jgi:hypothetical protein
VKPYLDFMQRLQMTAEDLPLLETMLRTMVAAPGPAPAAAPGQAQGQAEVDVKATKWYQELAEFYPETAAMMLLEAKARDGAVQQFTQKITALEQRLSQITGQQSVRQQQEEAATELSGLAQQLTALAGVYPDLQDKAHKAAFVQYLLVKNPLREQLKDPEIVEGFYLRFNRDGIAKRLSAQATTAVQQQAATVAGGFAEGGSARVGMMTPSPHEKELAEIYND